jgi:hypothetical protein
MTQATVTCCYCGRITAIQGQVAHQSKCLSGPAGDVAKEFMQRSAEYGGGMSTTKWRASEERKALGLPSTERVIEHFGGWRAFVEWCGLRHNGYNVPKTEKEKRDFVPEHIIHQRIDAMLAESKAALETAYDFRAIPAIDRGVKPVYNWRTMSYDHVHVLELR